MASASPAPPESGRASMSLRMTLRLALLVAAVATPAAQAPPTTLESIAQAMGATNLRTIEYAGSGYSFAFQQAPGPGEPWPLFVVDAYKVSIDYATPSMRFESTRAQGEHPPRGGAGQPIAGNPRSIQFVSGRDAWSEAAGGRVVPNPAATADRLRQLWLSPQASSRPPSPLAPLSPARRSRSISPACR